jgi:hypothetical protein
VKYLFTKEYIKSNYNNILVMAIILISMSMWVNLTPFILLGIFCFANALFLTYERYMKIPLDFEFSTFSTVIMTVKFGLVIGLLTAVLTKLTAIIYHKDLNVNSLFTMTGYILAAILANLFHLPFLILGLVVTILVNIYSFVVGKLLSVIPNYELIMYFVSNLLFNLIIFASFANIAYNII